jgi:hypothetical protein
MANEFLNRRVLKCTYDVAVNGGVDDTAYVVGSLPNGAIITGGFCIVRTNFDDGADESTTIAIGYTGAAAAFLGAVAGSVLNGLTPKITVFLPGIGAGADAAADTGIEVAALTALTYIPLTANVNVLVTLSNDTNFVAGKLDIYIEYVL